MNDVSIRMQRVRRRDTTPEMALRRRLWAMGLRYRTHVRGLPGTPDIVFRRAKLVVFVHGCYWHRHPGCRRSSTPKENRAFWETKFAANVARDERQRAALVAAGWTVFVAWECELEDEERLSAVAAKVAAALGSVKATTGSTQG